VKGILCACSLYSFSFQPEVPSRRIIFAYMIKGWSGAKEERKEKANKKSKKEN